MFEWDDYNLGHVARHNVEDFECEEAFYDPQRVEGEAYNTLRDKNYAFIGATETGRILWVMYTYRDGRIRVGTARDANKREKRRYRR